MHVRHSRTMCHDSERKRRRNLRCDRTQAHCAHPNGLLTCRYRLRVRSEAEWKDDMARTRTKCWSYNAGERGKSWCRAYEKVKGSTLYLEWMEPVADDEGTVLRDAQGNPQVRRARACLKHTDRARAEKQAREFAENAAANVPGAPASTLRRLVNRYQQEVTPSKKESKRKHDHRAARVFLAYFTDRATAGEERPRAGPAPRYAGQTGLGQLHRGPARGHDHGLGTALPEQPDPSGPEIPAFGPALGKRCGRGGALNSGRSAAIRSVVRLSPRSLKRWYSRPRRDGTTYKRSTKA